MKDGSWILNRFVELNASDCVIYENKSYSYINLHQIITRWMEEITRLGITEGECVTIPGEYSPQIIGLF